MRSPYPCLGSNPAGVLAVWPVGVWRFWILVFVCFVSAMAFPAFTAAEKRADVDGQRARLDDLQSRIHSLREQMRSKQGEKHQLSAALRVAEKAIGRLTRKIRQLDRRLADHRDRLTALEQDLMAQQGQLAQQRGALARQIRAAYAMGRQERLKILLNQQDPATVSRVLIYYDYIGRARVRELERIRAQLDQLAATKREIATEERRLAATQEDQRRKLERLEASQAERHKVIAQLTRYLDDQSGRLDQLRTDQRNLKTLISGIGEALADIPIAQPLGARFEGLRGRLAWPAEGRIISRFGTPKLGSLVWDGVMISAPEGREVRAVHHGRVAFADWLRGFGLLLILDHGDGYMTLYGHNQSLFKEAGDWVDVGEPVALVGASGGQERSGVYFGIRHQGRAVDPSDWCRGPERRRVG